MPPDLDCTGKRRIFAQRPQLYNHDAEGWFDTGDLARADAADADGYIRITG